jgi:hypothetical protein
MIQYGNHILDRLIAPEYSSVTVCGAPELPELPNYFGSFFLNNMFHAQDSDKAKSTIIVFLRRLAGAIREYRIGRDLLLQFVASPRDAQPGIELYLRSLAHFEYSIVNAYLVVEAYNEIARIYELGKVYSPGDDSAAERLGRLYNSFKHSLLPDIATPVWLTNEGLKSIYKQKGGDESLVTLSFVQLVNLFSDFEKEAHFLSEEAYRIIVKRRAALAGDGTM